MIDFARDTVNAGIDSKVIRYRAEDLAVIIDPDSDLTSLLTDPLPTMDISAINCAFFYKPGGIEIPRKEMPVATLLELIGECADIRFVDYSVLRYVNVDHRRVWENKSEGCFYPYYGRGNLEVGLDADTPEYVLNFLDGFFNPA